ncbi:MAG: SUMF1/EgtB/PvdO family nonheme iron enzyme [Deltaproteobacteria bacterium]|nr:SUMF1/EgtB/PvdO family nonheme iron enzyme [Deltaproteobacteria bacterium]
MSVSRGSQGEWGNRLGLAAVALAVLALAACSTETRPYEGAAPPDKDDVGPPAIDHATMVLVAGGTFEMGHPVEPAGPYGNPWKANELPPHPVTLSEYWIDTDEVTGEQFALFLSYAAGEKHYDPLSPIERVGEIDYQAMAGHQQRPASYVSWLAAVEYCEWVGKLLPTEAQWERAAKGTEQQRFPWGEDGATCQLANYYTGSTWCVGESGDVGSYSPDGDSPDGVHDLAGNVAEWTADGYGPYGADPVTDPLGPEPSWEGVVVRGGGYNEAAASLRTTARWAADPTDSSPGIGFRCVALP